MESFLFKRIQNTKEREKIKEKKGTKKWGKIKEKKKVHKKSFHLPLFSDLPFFYLHPDDCLVHLQVPTKVEILHLYVLLLHGQAVKNFFLNINIANFTKI